MYPKNILDIQSHINLFVEGMSKLGRYRIVEGVTKYCKVTKTDVLLILEFLLAEMMKFVCGFQIK